MTTIEIVEVVEVALPETLPAMGDGPLPETSSEGQAPTLLLALTAATIVSALLARHQWAKERRSGPRT